jgi:hypothetical protein
MITTTVDPISMNEASDLENAPFVIEGEGDHAIKIYFESERNRQEYLEIDQHGAGNTPGLKKVYDAIADNPDTGTIN